MGGEDDGSAVTNRNESGAAEKIERRVADRRERYREELQALYNRLQTGDYSRNPNIDAMLFSLEKYCSKRGITCEIRLRRMRSLASLPEDAALMMSFYLVYWAMQYCETVFQPGNISVEVSGGEMLGTGRLKAAVTIGESSVKTETGRRDTNRPRLTKMLEQLQNSILRQAEDSLKGYGNVDIEQSDNINAMTVEWKL